MIIEAIYFDGQSSAGYPAKVNLLDEALQITYSQNGDVKNINWDIGKIHNNDLSDSGKVYLKYGNFPFQYIEVTGGSFANALRVKYPQAKFHKSAYSFVFSTGFMGLLALGVMFVGILALAYFVFLPTAAERIATTVPIEWEQKLGDATYEQMVSSTSIDDDNSRRLQQFFSHLNYKSKYQIQPVVVKDKVVNAYALPGGRIVVYEGILRAMDNADELSALMSHEFSHVELRHSTKNIFRSLSSYLLLSILFGDASGITAVVIENANQIKQLGYSRELEHEADENGLRLMKHRKINPAGMKHLFEALEKEEGEAPEFSQFMSTHPLTAERISFVNREIAKGNYIIEEDKILDSLFLEIKNNLTE